MPFDAFNHHRRPLRLRSYDYTLPGAYFVTIVTHGRQCLYGEVAAGAMRLNDAGCMVQTVWDELASYYPGVVTDAFVVMPNHIHGIVRLTGTLQSEPIDGQPRGVEMPEGVGMPEGVEMPRGHPLRYRSLMSFTVSNRLRPIVT